ncbi:MAG: helix-turn-helix transcriptional regulator [Ruminococcus sp.]|nr:helix-turn-helix transcriptional regulator [Ruminococcus sp.]MCD7800879.1 helix-turn-helix transcriptional regulator [Ruminococcus sp.]
MVNEHICPCTKNCPLQRAMKSIGGRWKMSILCSLSNDGATRYNDIKRKMNGISNTMLAKSLKELEDDGLVKRTEYLEVPIRVEYEITDDVRSLIPILMELAVWGSNLKKNPNI